jgi:hypothetical protein
MTIWALRKVLSCSSPRRCIEALCKRPAVLELKVLQALDLPQLRDDLCAIASMRGLLCSSLNSLSKQDSRAS